MSSTLKVNGIQAVSGTANAISLTASDKTCTANITNNLSNRNLIINGAMQVNQRGSTAGLDDFNVVTGNLYTLDRWLGVGDSSFDWDSARIKQVSDSPDEFSNSLRVDIGNTETPGAGQNGLVRTKIEAQDLQHLAYGTSSAKTCTLSFWVRSNKTGTYCVQIQQRDADKHLLYEYSISSANTWEKKTITFSGNTSDAITNDNGIGFQISFHLACHSDDHESATTSWAANSGGSLKATSNQVNLWDHADNVWYLTGVQLEVGNYATDYEHRKFQDELYNCQRYYQQVGTPTQDGQFCIGASHLISSGDQPRVGYFGQNNLRATPTITEFGDGLRVIGSGSNTPALTMDDINVTFPSAFMQFNATHTDIGDDNEIVVVTNTANGGIKIEAEL